MRPAMLVSALALGWATAAAAAPITVTYDITATFTDGPNPIVSAILGVTYDPTTAGTVTVNSFSSAVLGGDVPVTGYFGGPGQALSFGNNCFGMGACAVRANHAQFAEGLATSGNGTAISGGLLSYSVLGSGGAIYDSNSQTVTQAATAVPEPSALALLGLPVALLALLTVRRPRQDASTA